MGGVDMASMDSLLTIQNHLPGYVWHWQYTEHGRPVMIVARYDDDNGKTYRQFRFEFGEWIEGMPTPPYPLFGLASLQELSPLQAIFICEGEKCASTLHQLGWPAVAAALGAQNVESSDWNSLRHFNRFIILRDNDKAGIAFAQSVSYELYRIRKGAEILVANLMSNLPGGDIVDWLLQTTLRGHSWDGYDPISKEVKLAASSALEQEITRAATSVETCPHVRFQPLEAKFEGLPRPLETHLLPVPTFPLELLPPPVAEYLRLTSNEFSQVPDFTATTFLALLAGIVGRSVHLKMRPGFQWVETANCWTILVGPPSSKKSPIARRILGLLKPLDDRASQEFKSAVRDYRRQEKEAERSKSDFDEPPPTRRRYATDDVTMPKLRELMANNPRGITLKSDELKAPLERLDKQGSEGDRSFIMSCWSGLETYSEDRMCRSSLIDIPVALTWIGCVQPTVLAPYLRQSMSSNSGADGFIQRFQFPCYPDVGRPFELSTEPISDALIKKIQDLIKQIDDDALVSDRELCFCQGAQTRFDQWLVDHENDVRSGRHSPHWEAHLGKKAKALAVLVIVLHRLGEATNRTHNDEVSLDVFEKAVALQAYFEAHARRCYESITGGAFEDARTILSQLKQQRIPSKFKAQDIYRDGLGGLDSTRTKEALALLEDYDWVVSSKEASAGGRRSEFWNLHPRAFNKHA